MQKRKFTIVTELKQNNNSDLIAYFDESRQLYNKALRETFHTIKNAQDFNKSSYNSYLQNKYDILKRTAGSIISNAQGKYNALLELKKYEKKQLEHKISYLETKLIPKLVQQRADNNTMLRLKMNVSLVKHRNLKLKLVAKFNKLNHLKQKLDNLSYQIESGNLKLCFGTKHLLKTNYTKFVEKRDSQMSFIGSKSELSGNQMLQLTHNPKNNQFMIQLRKDFGENKKAKGNDKYVHGKVYFRHHKHHIVDILRHGYSPLTYKIIKRNNRYYLYCTFEIQRDDEDVITRSSYGTIGLDFNKGFVTLSETNQYGHLVDTQLLPYRFKQGNKTTNDLRQIANHVVKLSVQHGKDICIENLNFNRTKSSKTESKHGKKYNDMIHSLSYRQFMETIESVAYRNLVKVIKVNPAWTSWIAKKKYCPSMKLNTHIGASYVIARRGQGFQDSV